MSSALFAGLVVMGAVEVSLTTLDGDRHTGRLIELSRDAMVIDSAGTEIHLDVADIVSVVPEVDFATPLRSIAEVKLVDKTVLFLAHFQMEGDQVSGQLSSPGNVSLRRKDISAIRWLDHLPRLDQESAKSVQLQWEEAYKADVASDRIVIRRQRNSDRAQRVVLNGLSGIVHDVTEELVRFEYSKKQLDVPRRNKVEGLILYHPRSRPSPPPVCLLTDVSGSEIHVQSLSVEEDGVECRTVAGSDMKLRWESIRRIDFSQGKIVFLSDMEPERVKWTPFLSAGRSQEWLSRLYAPRRDQNFEGHGLRLRFESETRDFEKGLAVHSRAELIYRIDGQFRRFVAWAGIDPDLGDQGNVRLVIHGDSQQLFESNVSGAGGPVALDVDVSGIRRLKILVDFGNDLDVADHLYLCDSKVTK